MIDIPHVVGDVMTRKVVAVSRDATFKEIVQAMERWKVSALPVLINGRRVIGVVSEADLILKEEFRDSRFTLTEQARRLDETTKAGGVTAEDCMSSPAATVHAEATLSQAARIMARRRVKRLPVTDVAGRLVGVVSRTDLLKVFLRSDEDIAQEVREQVIRSLFHTASPPVRVRVTEGVVSLSGVIPDASLVPVAARLVRSIEGVVDVDCDLRSRPDRPSEEKAVT